MSRWAPNLSVAVRPSQGRDVRARGEWNRYSYSVYIEMLRRLSNACPAARVRSCTRCYALKSEEISAAMTLAPRATGTAITDHARRRSALKASAQSTSADRASFGGRGPVCAQRWPAPRSVDVGLRDLTQARRTRGPACRRGRRGLDRGLGHRLGLRQGLDRGRQGLDHPGHHLAVSDSAR